MTASSISNSLCIALGSATAPSNQENVQTAANLKAALGATTFDKNKPLDALQIIVLQAQLAQVYNPMDLSAWTAVLQPSAVVSVRVLSADGNTEPIPAATLQTVHTSFLLAGLVGTTERRETDGSRFLTASKKYSAQESVGLAAAPIRVSIQLLVDDDADADYHTDALLIDEDNLLSDASNLLAPPPAMSAAATKDDCSGRKACDDCTCGRADAEGTATTTTTTAQQPQRAPIQSSSCGKCSLGDAFRCASCPYLGKPAFKAGQEHLVLDLQDDF